MCDGRMMTFRQDVWSSSSFVLVGLPGLIILVGCGWDQLFSHLVCDLYPFYPLVYVVPSAVWFMPPARGVAGPAELWLCSS